MTDPNARQLFRLRYASAQNELSHLGKIFLCVLVYAVNGTAVPKAVLVEHENRLRGISEDHGADLSVSDGKSAIPVATGRFVIQ